jgi:hypothetical protein
MYRLPDGWPLTGDEQWAVEFEGTCPVDWRLSADEQNRCEYSIDPQWLCYDKKTKEFSGATYQFKCTSGPRLNIYLHPTPVKGYGDFK